MELSTIISPSTLYDFIRGPLVWVSFIVFFIGLIYQVFNFLSMTEKHEKVVYNPRPRKKIKSKGFSLETVYNMMSRIKLSIVGVSPVMIVVTTVFHICLVVAPIFLLAHNILLDNSIGISFFSFSEKITDYMTILLIACGLFFLLRRIFIARVRAITTFYDYLILFLALAPFISGYLAYHQILPEFISYRLMVSLHILSGELMLMAVPFTKFVHMVFFFIFRFMVVSEYSLGEGERTW